MSYTECWDNKERLEFIRKVNADLFFRIIENAGLGMDPFMKVMYSQFTNTLEEIGKESEECQRKVKSLHSIVTDLNDELSIREGIIEEKQAEIGRLNDLLEEMGEEKKSKKKQ